MTISELIGNFFNSSGPGGIVVISVMITAATVYYLLTRWILDGGKEEQERDRFR